MITNIHRLKRTWCWSHMNYHQKRYLLRHGFVPPSVREKYIASVLNIPWLHYRIDADNVYRTVYTHPNVWTPNVGQIWTQITIANNP